MEDQQFLDAVTTAIGAAQSFLDTDAAYGPDDPRTLRKKEQLMQAMGTLTPTNVDLPELHVVRDDEPEPTFRAPVADPQRWSQVRAYLTQGCELPDAWIDALHNQGKIYADLRGNAVFIGENERGVSTAAYIRGSSLDVTGIREDPGWFTARLPAEAEGGRPVLILAESPVDALSALEMHRRIHRDRPDGKGERGPVAVMATEGAGPMPHWAIRETLNRGGMVRVATDNTPVGQLIWEQLREQYPSGQVIRAQPSMKDWNEDLRFHNACYRNPREADRRLHELHRENAPDEQARAAVRETIRHLAPAPPRDGWDRER